MEFIKNFNFFLKFLDEENSLFYSTNLYNSINNKFRENTKSFNNYFQQLWFSRNKEFGSI